MGNINNELVIIREFNAPRELVWRCWTEPEMLMNWWGPKTFTTPNFSVDLQVGGKYLLCMVSGEGQEFWVGGKYLEINPYDKLVYTDSFSDSEGNWVDPASLGFPGEWEHESIVTVTLEDLGEKTRMTLRHEGIPAGEMKEGTNTGWNEMFDKLQYLIEVKNGVKNERN